MFDVNKVLSVAIAENGYLEKQKQYANNKEILNDKTAGAGKDNVTKYWLDMNPSLQGKHWCMCFAVWCYATAYGKENAKKILGWPAFTYSVKQAASYFKNNGRYFSTPCPGDLILFNVGLSSGHVGIVTKVTSDRVYTIEGNTSSAKGVVANGGAVNQKSYAFNNSRISGYGRPTFNTDNKRSTLKRGSKGADVIFLQQRLAALGYSVGNIDGSFGPQTENAVKEYQHNNNLACDGVVGPNTWNCLLKGV